MGNFPFLAWAIRRLSAFILFADWNFGRGDHRQNESGAKVSGSLFSLAFSGRVKFKNELDEEDGIIIFSYILVIIYDIFIYLFLRKRDRGLSQGTRAR